MSTVCPDWLEGKRLGVKMLALQLFAPGDTPVVDYQTKNLWKVIKAVQVLGYKVSSTVFNWLKEGLLELWSVCPSWGRFVAV